MDLTRQARKITTTLFLAMSLGSAGFLVAATVNAIVGAEISGNPIWAGLPSAMFTLGTAISAFVLGLAMERFGRRVGMLIGLGAGLLGTAVAAAAIGLISFPLFLAGMAFSGAARAALQLGRFAAAEVHPPEKRGRAISNVVIGGTVGAVLGPWLAGPMGQWAKSAGYREMFGPYVASFILLALAALAIFILLRPDPRQLGREIERLYPEIQADTSRVRTFLQLLRVPAAAVAVVAMVVSQAVMVMLMGITALYMKANQHELLGISAVISAHTFGMYAFSIFSGQLVDRWGRGQVILVGGLGLVVACILAPLSTALVPLALALFVLGLGWNFCYVGGSSLLADQLNQQERARIQGINDLFVGLATALGSFISGLIFAALGFGMVGIIGALLSIIPVGMTLWWQLGKRKFAPATIER
ncbi:MAG: MFS transporter [Anaerolineales bacterium]|jgi:MFS family permease